MVPQKSDFSKKIVEKVLNMCFTPPLVSELRDMRPKAKVVYRKGEKKSGFFSQVPQSGLKYD